MDLFPQGKDFADNSKRTESGTVDIHSEAPIQLDQVGLCCYWGCEGVRDAVCADAYWLSGGRYAVRLCLSAASNGAMAALRAGGAVRRRIAAGGGAAVRCILRPAHHCYITGDGRAKRPGHALPRRVSAHHACNRPPDGLRRGAGPYSPPENLARPQRQVAFVPCDVPCFFPVGRGDDWLVLKRVVTTLLQNMDAMPGNVFLVAATNHHHLLDTAIWRRFNISILLELPNVQQRERIISDYLREILSDYHVDVKILVLLLKA